MFRLVVMKQIFIISGLIFHLTSMSTFAQSSFVDNNLVIYDPLFWRDQLKLSDSQSKKIREINVEYYEGLITFYKKQGKDAASMKAEIAKQLTKRSERIWNTFEPRQRRRWEKLRQQGLTFQSSL